MSKTTTKFSMLMVIIVLLLNITPIQAFAEETNDVDEVGEISVTLDSNGQLDLGLGFDKNGDSTDVWNRIFDKYKTVIVGFTGIAMLTSIIIFIVKFMQLQASSGNPTAKAQALQGLLWTGLATAGIGSVTVIVGFFYYAL